jgi:hypothetical protein
MMNWCWHVLCQLCSFKPFPGKIIPTSGSWDQSGWCSVGTIANDAEQFNFDAVFKPGTQARSRYYGPHVKEYRFPSISSELFVLIPTHRWRPWIEGSWRKSIISPVQGGKIFQSLLDVFHCWIQAEVFDTCRDLVQSALDGYNVGPSADSLNRWTQWTQSFWLGGQPQSHTKPLSTRSCSNNILHRFHRSHMISYDHIIFFLEVTMFAYGQTGAGKQGTQRARRAHSNSLGFRFGDGTAVGSSPRTFTMYGHQLSWFQQSISWWLLFIMISDIYQIFNQIFKIQEYSWNLNS